MNKIKYILITIPIFILLSCNNEIWNEHYNKKPETIDKNIWDAIQEKSDFSLYVKAMKDHKLDSLFTSDDVYTLFIPDNDAINNYLNFDSTGITLSILENLISKYFILSSSINGTRKIQVLSEKYFDISWYNNELYFNNILLKKESSIFKNGKYFIISQVPKPYPNLYEYIAINIPVLKQYIDSQDSIILDMERSKPLGFDELGRTIYDTVAIIINKFELKYFPVSKESRNKKATLVFPRQEDYNNGLTLMAKYLGGSLNDYNDIPFYWQKKYLLPYLLDRGIFENLLEESAFIIPTGKDTLKLKNILGDTVVIRYKPTEKVICSNGYAYNYQNFTVPDTLYKSPVRIQGESFTEPIGSNKFRWKSGVKISSDKSFEVKKDFVSGASNDSVISVLFDKGYSGKFSIEFPIDILTPQTFQMLIRTNMLQGGIYNIYINDKLVKTIDYYSYVLNQYYYRSVVIPTKIYKPSGNFNFFDCYVDNITAFGIIKLKFEYVGPSTVLYNGLVIDYIEFRPYKK